MIVATKEVLAFRSQSLLLFIGFIVQNLITPIMFYSIYAMKFSYPGWSLEQVLFFYGTYILIEGIAFTFFQQVLWKLPNRLLDGRFDYYLVRGISPLFLSFSDAFFLEGSGDILTGLVFIILFWKPGNVIGYALTILLAEIFILSLVILFLAIAIKAVRIESLSSIFWYSLEFGRYPIEVYPFVIRFVFTFIFPVTLISWLPAKIFFGLSLNMLAIPTCITFALLAVSLIAWKKALRSYTSAGG